jgi:hypothetical protein
LESGSGGWFVVLVQSRPAVGLVSLFFKSTAILMHIRAEVLASFPPLPLILGDASDVFSRDLVGSGLAQVPEAFKICALPEQKRDIRHRA